MTSEAFRIRDEMIAAHKVTTANRPYPDKQIFLDNPGLDRYVSGCTSEQLLKEWFGAFLEPLLKLGGCISVYEVPEQAIASNDERQIVYQQRQAECITRGEITMPDEPFIYREHHSVAN